MERVRVFFSPTKNRPFRSEWQHFSTEKIIFPVNLDNRHWSLVVVYMEERAIVCYDSLGVGSSTLERAKIVKDYLLEQYEHIFERPVDTSEKALWRISAHCATPRQTNGYDCGIYLCLYVYCITQGIAVEEIEPNHVCRFRHYIAYCIMYGET
jgi:sentrin-specific protease 1